MKSLASCVSTETLVSTLISKLSNPSNRQKVIVWVEGKNWRVYHKFFKSELIIEYGKVCGDQILEGHKKLMMKVPSQKSIVIKDADFKRLEQQNLGADPNIFYTDGHDVEMMMIKEEKVQAGICDGFEYDGDRNQFFEEVFHDLYFLSFFKWYDYHYKHCYSYEPMSKIRQSQANLRDLDWIESNIYSCSKSKWDSSNHSTPFVRIKTDDVRDFIFEKQSVDWYEMTNGHDYYNRLCFHIEKKMDYTRNEDSLNDTVIAHFGIEQFEQTNLHRSLKQWCDANIDILKAV